MYVVPWCPSLVIFTAEAVEDRLIRFLNAFHGVSLASPAPAAGSPTGADLLAMLVGRGVDPPGVNAYRWFTNCATSALGFLTAACCTHDVAEAYHPLLVEPSKNGTSISWVYEIGRSLGIHSAYVGQALPRVCLLGYANGGHVEWKLGNTFLGKTPHGGGGRAGNAITVGAGDITRSAVGPLTDIFDLCPRLAQLAPSPDAAADELLRVYLGPDTEPAN